MCVHSLCSKTQNLRLPQPCRSFCKGRPLPALRAPWWGRGRPGSSETPISFVQANALEGEKWRKTRQSDKESQGIRNDKDRPTNSPVKPWKQTEFRSAHWVLQHFKRVCPAAYAKFAQISWNFCYFQIVLCSAQHHAGELHDRRWNLCLKLMVRPDNTSRLASLHEIMSSLHPWCQMNAWVSSCLWSKDRVIVGFVKPVKMEEEFCPARSSNRTGSSLWIHHQGGCWFDTGRMSAKRGWKWPKDKKIALYPTRPPWQSHRHRTSYSRTCLQWPRSCIYAWSFRNNFRLFFCNYYLLPPAYYLLPTTTRTTYHIPLTTYHFLLLATCYKLQTTWNTAHRSPCVFWRFWCLISLVITGHRCSGWFLGFGNEFELLTFAAFFFFSLLAEFAQHLGHLFGCLDLFWCSAHDVTCCSLATTHAISPTPAHPRHPTQLVT